MKIASTDVERDRVFSIREEDAIYGLLDTPHALGAVGVWIVTGQR